MRAKQWIVALSLISSIIIVSSALADDPNTSNTAPSSTPTGTTTPTDTSTPPSTAPANGTTPATSTPGTATPTNSTPATSTPTDSTPATSTPADSTPATGTPTDSTPATSAPTTPTDNSSTSPTPNNSGTTTGTPPTDAGSPNAPAQSSPAPSSSANEPETFQSVCVKSWMGRIKEIKDKVDFQNFGEKYCHCADTQQPLDTEEAINHAAQVCMSRTLLQDAVDNLRDDIGLSEAKADDVTDYCLDRWELVYPNMDDTNKKAATDYCNCANPKLLDLFKQAGKITDRQFFSSIDDIAATCSGKTGK